MLTIRDGGDQKLYYATLGEEEGPYCLVVAKDEDTAHQKALKFLIGETERRNAANASYYKRQGLQPREVEPTPGWDDITVREVLKEEILF